MNATLKIALLMMSLAFFGCTGNSGPATPPETGDPMPEGPAESAEAPAINPEGEGPPPDGSGN